MVQVLQPLQVEGNAGCQVQLLFELPHRHVAAAVCYAEHLPRIFQQHSHGENIRDHVSRLVHGLRVPDVVPAAGAGPELWGVGPRAGRVRSPRGRPGRSGVAANGAPRRRRCLRRPPPHGPPPGPSRLTPSCAHHPSRLTRLARVIPAPLSGRASPAPPPLLRTGDPLPAYPRWADGPQLTKAGFTWTWCSFLNKGNGHGRFENSGEIY